MLFIADSHNLPVPTLFGAQTTNSMVRSNKDWEEMEGRAVSKRREPIPENVIIADSPTFYISKQNPYTISYNSELSESDDWAKIEVVNFSNGYNKPTDTEILYAFSKNRAFFLDIPQFEAHLTVNQEFQD